MRNLLIWLPGSVGETIILPRVRYVYDHLPLLDWRTKRYAASEARRIRSAILAKSDKFIIVFDCEIAGLGYGGILYMLAIARYIISQGGFTAFYIVDTDYLHVDGQMDQDEISYFISDIVHIAEAMLDPEVSSVCLISPETLSKVVDTPSNEFLLFDDFTRNRRPFFRDCFNVFNNLMANSPDAVQDRVLFSPDEFKCRLPESSCATPYVSWACRYSLKGTDFGRQTMRDEFLKSYTYLRNRFPNHNILVVSDSLGCQHYSSLATDLQIKDLLFSKDYSPDFLGDAALTINSDFFFWYRGGGMAIIPLLSRMPYECHGPLMNEIMWDKRRLTSWQGKSQEWIVLEKHQFVDDRSRETENIGLSWNGVEE